MQNIRDILNTKGTTIWSASPDETVYEAIHRMAEHGIGALLVMDGDQLVGFFMSSPVLTISPDASVQEGLKTMTEKRIRHLPVADDSGVLGIVSIGDLVKAVIEDQQELIDQLERYIVG